MKKPIDENMVVKVSESDNGINYYDVRENPFSLHGVWYDTDAFYRIPRDVARSVSKNIHQMCDMTAGGRVRFSTDSSKIYLKAAFRNAEEVVSMNSISVKGFDLYCDGVFAKAFHPPYGKNEGVINTYVDLYEKRDRELTIHFPLYASITELYIGIEEGSKLLPPKPYDHPLPIVYYGSSITNGAAASRPGMTYEAILSRMLSSDHHNLGFGGSAKGETEMAEYISGLPMSVFVYDYDFNAPTVEHLAETHERFFKIFRSKNPNTPVIMISKPTFGDTSDKERRFEVIKRTYANAVNDGDKNVYLLCGSDFFDGLSADYTVDGIHPTDLGFMYMAKGIYPILREILEK